MSRIVGVAVPKWGIEMQEGTFVGWRVEIGAQVARGEEIADMETEKIVNALEAPADGILRRRIADEGDTLAVGALVGVLSEDGVDDAEIDAFVADYLQDGNEPNAANNAGDAGDPGGSTAPVPEIRASLAARRLAEKLDIDLSAVQGSGRRGRITPGDVQQAAHAVPAQPNVQTESGYVAESMSGTRKTIARRLVDSKQTIPHYYLTAEISVDALLEYRAQLAGQGVTVSITDLLVRATALTLLDVPEINAHLVADEIRQFSQANIAVAVATDTGLVAPVIHGAEVLSPAELSAKLSLLTEQARAGQLKSSDLEGGTFTVSNLGMFDVQQFTAIINPPQVGILAIGAVQAQLALDAGQPTTIQRMMVTLSCDHRVVDGAVGGRFLQALRRCIESPLQL